MIWEGLTPPYSTIVADPPWKMGPPTGASKAAPQRGHYSTTTTDDICAMPVVELCRRRRASLAESVVA